MRRRLLNALDLGQARQLSLIDAELLSSSLIAELRSLETASHRDPTGIPYRDSDDFQALFQGRTVQELGAAYVTLKRWGCQPRVIEALRMSLGSADD